MNQHPEAHPQAGPFSSYDDFKSQYLSLSPEVADSPALLASLIRYQAFDWLNQLVEESLGEEPETRKWGVGRQAGRGATPAFRCPQSGCGCGNSLLRAPHRPDPPGDSSAL